MRIEWRAGVPLAAAGRDALAVLSFDAGEPVGRGAGVEGRLLAREGSLGHVVLSAAHQEPLLLPPAAEVEARLGATVRSWRDSSDGRAYEGPWKEAVVRSGLALKLLVFAPSGAIAAAATTSLPEEIGGERNWDYRYSWPRDSAFTLRALLALGCGREAEAFFSWLLHASQLMHPKVQVLYRLNGGAEADEESLPLAGYRGSRPVRIGNGAAAQTQLDVYGELLDAAAEFAGFAGGLDRRRRLAEVADLVCELWRDPDAGIWEVRSDAAHFTQSKMMCFVALDRAVALALEAADEEAVDPDQLPRSLRLDVPLRPRLARRLVGRRVAGDEREPLHAGVEPVPAQAAPDPIVRDDDPAPAILPQLARDPPRPVARMPEREGDDPLLHQRDNWLGRRGRRRSLGRSIPRPCRSTRRFQR